jgi:hypothetical protein
LRGPQVPSAAYPSAKANCETRDDGKTDDVLLPPVDVRVICQLICQAVLEPKSSNEHDEAQGKQEAPNDVSHD